MALLAAPSHMIASAKNKARNWKHSELERFRAWRFLKSRCSGFLIKPFKKEREIYGAAMDRTRSYMESHCSESITIEQLARLADLSPKYYVTIFKKMCGKTAIDYLTEVRVYMAMKLML